MTPQQQIDKLKRDLDNLSQQFYSNNFPSHQDFNKSSSFNYVLKVPHYASAPTKANVGEIIEVSGKLYICSATNTFTLVGTQT